MVFSAGTPTGSISTGGIQTIVSEPTIVISSENPAVAAGNIVQNTTNNVIYAFANNVTVNNATITGLQITTSGTYAASDVVGLKAWYSIDNTFDSGTDILLSTKSSSLGAGFANISGLDKSCIKQRDNRLYLHYS